MGAAWAAKTGRCPQKQWYECAKGVGGGYVCACQGCGPACQQYEPPPGGGVNT